MADPQGRATESGEPQVLVTGIGLGESPRWHDGRLWLSDWMSGEILAVDLTGRREVMARVPSMPFCFDWLPDGRLVAVSGGDRLLLRQEPDGTMVRHADLSGLDSHSWNDIVVDRHGNLFVNNIGFDFPGGEFRTGIIAVVRPDGTASQVADGVSFPNGMAVTSDGRTLIVAESYANRLTAFDLSTDRSSDGSSAGSLTNRRVWAEIPDAAPDGICLDAENAVWYADVPNRRCVRVREGGEIAQIVHLDRGGFACALGGADRRTLFVVTADWGAMGTGDPTPTGQVVTVSVAVPGQDRRI